MNLTGLIDIKERIVTGEPLTPKQRDFMLACINGAVLLAQAAAFLDRLADRYERHLVGSYAADCRAMAARLRGEPVAVQPEHPARKQDHA